jgi:hypothetical protein
MFWSTKSPPKIQTITPTSSSNVTVSVGGGGSGGSGTYTGTITLPTASGGGTGQYMGTSGWTSVISSVNTSQGTITMSGNLTIDSENPHINTKKNKIDLDKLCRNLEIVNEMFHIIVPDWNRLEKNSTLMDAYMQYDSAKHIEPRYNSEQYIAAFEQYRLLEALTEENHDS